jgi:hypothetical protein
VEVACRVCGGKSVGAPNKRYCSRRCLLKAYRERHAAERAARRELRRRELFCSAHDLFLTPQQDFSAWLDQHGNLWIKLGREEHDAPPPPKEHCTALVSWYEFVEPLVDGRVRRGL